MSEHRFYGIFLAKYIIKERIKIYYTYYRHKTKKRIYSKLGKYTMKNIIEPKVLKGFRDFLPEAELKRKALFSAAEAVFSSFGFVPIDTPVLEYTDVLLRKGGGETDKQVYSFKDHGGRDVSMRFDLTVPFARFTAANKNSLFFPFKRYHIAKVWRGENTQKGRYREFYQCDFDIVGTDSSASDLEILLLMKESLLAIGVKDFKIHLSNRGILNSFLEINGILDKSVEILRAVDKLAKIGREKVKELLTEAIGSSDTAIDSSAGFLAESILDFITPENDFIKTLDKLASLCKGDNNEISRIREIYTALKEGGWEKYYILNPSITRGLDYYTGIVFETFLTGKEGIGSVCSGGRYNNLTSLYSADALPGVGASIGVDRLLAALEEDGEENKAFCSCIVFNMDKALLGHLHKIASILRGKGISCEVYPETTKLGKQFSYAEKKNIPCGVIIGSEEKDTDTITVKDLIERENFEKMNLDEGIKKIISIMEKME